MKTYILIMVLSQGMSQGGNSTLSVEFDSQTQCTAAMVKITQDLGRNSVNVMSANCFEK